jgi:hypothetical protein
VKQHYMYNNRLADVDAAKEVANIARWTGRNITPAMAQSGATSSDSVGHVVPAAPYQATVVPSLATASSVSPAYMRRPGLQSTLVQFGIHHPQSHITDPNSRVFFSDLELGYIASFIRQDNLNMQKYTALYTVIGDNLVSRFTIPYP